MDVIARLPAPLTPGDDNLPQALELHLGGVGANTAVALSRWGVAARLLGCVGRDAFGDLALRLLRQSGVSVSAVARVAKPTGLIFIPVDPDGQRTIIGSRGANACAPAAAQAIRSLRGVRWLHLVGYTLLSRVTVPVVAGLVARARRNGIGISLDAGLAPSRKARRKILALAPKLDVLFLAEEEAAGLCGKCGRAAREAVADLGAGTVIVKRGENGCLFLHDGKWRETAPFKVNAVDTTGAGDAFAAGFILARLRGWPLADAVSLANAMGAAAASVFGAGENMPGPADVAAMLKNNSRRGRTASAGARLLHLLRTGKKSFQVV